jgi:precorrin-4/cobalt-precorrin-4 C11-methyltransferase
MKVYFIGSGPGDPELMTRKAERLLKEARICVYAGSLLSPGVVGMIPEEAEKHDSAALDLKELTAIYKDAKERDVDVMRLHSGDLSVYSAIGEQIHELDKLDIDYDVVPGVSSFQAAAAALKQELTAPEISQTVVLTRMPGETPVGESDDIRTLAQTRATLCIFLSVHKMEEITATLSHFYGPDCPVAVVYHASWPDQKIVRGTLQDIGEKVHAAHIKKTAMIIVGRALGPVPARSKLYDEGFSHGYRKGAKG